MEKFIQDSSVKLKITAFREVVRSQVHSRRPTLSIDRKSAIEARKCISLNLNMTIATQIEDLFMNSSILRDDLTNNWLFPSRMIMTMRQADQQDNCLMSLHSIFTHLIAVYLFQQQIYKKRS